MTTLEVNSLKVKNKNISLLYRCLPVLKATDSYFVGGCVRDYLLNRPIDDIDLVTTKNLVQCEKNLKELFPNLLMKHCGQSFGVLKLFFDFATIDLAKTRCDEYLIPGKRQSCKVVTKNISLEEDIIRRDFTINGLLMTNQFQILDYSGKGLDDLKKKVIAFIGDSRQRIIEDPLRSIRCIRFYSQLEGFSIDGETQEAIFSMSDWVKHVSKERWGQEIAKILLGYQGGQAIQCLQEMNLLNFSRKEPLSLKEINFLKALKGDTIEETLILRYSYLYGCLGRSIDAVEWGHLSKKTQGLILWLGQWMNRSMDFMAFSKHFKNRNQLAEGTRLLSLLSKQSLVVPSIPFYRKELAISGRDLLKIGVLDKDIKSIMEKLLKEVQKNQITNDRESLIRKVEVWI